MVLSLYYYYINDYLKLTFEIYYDFTILKTILNSILDFMDGNKT